MEDFKTLNYAVLYEQFKREKQYLNNVAAATVRGYGWAWKAFAPTLGLQQSALVTKAEIVSRIAQLRADGLTAVTINTYLRSVNTFFHWLHTEGHTAALLKIPRLKEESKVIQSFNEAQLELLISFKPESDAERRLHVVTCLILDCGARIDEVLSASRKDVDLDNLLFTIREAKGGKQRVVPISLKMRKRLVRHLDRQKPEVGDLLFFTGPGEKLNQRNALRDFKRICKRLRIAGPRCSFHTLRHSFGKAYIRYGGDVFRLQRVLGHAKLEMTRRYVNLETSDLQECHQTFSLLARSRS